MAELAVTTTTSDGESVPAILPTVTLEQLRQDVTLFKDEQVKYLEAFAKYSPRRSRFKLVKPKDMPLRKEAYVKDNLVYLKADEQLTYNDQQLNLDYHYRASWPLLMATAGVSFVFYAIRTPLHRNLFKESVKSVLLGAGTALVYRRYHHSKYLECVHETYIRILNAKKDTLTRPMDY